MWEEVEGTSIILKDGETEAAADLSEHRMIQGGILASPCLREREGQCFHFPQKETGPQRPGGSEASTAFCFCPEQRPLQGPFQFLPFLRTSERSSFDPFTKDFP